MLCLFPNIPLFFHIPSTNLYLFPFYDPTPSPLTSHSVWGFDSHLAYLFSRELFLPFILIYVILSSSITYVILCGFCFLALLQLQKAEVDEKARKPFLKTASWSAKCSIELQTLNWRGSLFYEEILKTRFKPSNLQVFGIFLIYVETDGEKHWYCAPLVCEGKVHKNFWNIFGFKHRYRWKE